MTEWIKVIGDCWLAILSGGLAITLGLAFGELIGWVAYGPRPHPHNHDRRRRREL